jgi:hypothetical protein
MVEEERLHLLLGAGLDMNGVQLETTALMAFARRRIRSSSSTGSMPSSSSRWLF